MMFFGLEVPLLVLGEDCWGSLAPATERTSGLPMVVELSWLL